MAFSFARLEIARFLTREHEQYCDCETEMKLYNSNSDVWHELSLTNIAEMRTIYICTLRYASIFFWWKFSPSKLDLGYTLTQKPNPIGSLCIVRKGWRLKLIPNCFSNTLEAQAKSLTVSYQLWKLPRYVFSLKPGFHYPSWRPGFHAVNSARWNRAPIKHGPCWRVMETGHPSTRAVRPNSGRQLG